MARTDWYTQKWSSYSDPTGVLDSTYALLMTTTGATQATVSDLLQQVPGAVPSVSFNLSNYKVAVDYAWPADQSRKPGQSDEYRLWARGANIQATGTTNYAVQDGYSMMWRKESLISNQATLNLERWAGGVVTVLATTTIDGASSSVFETGTRHSASLRVSGSNPNLLTGIIDGFTYFDYNDAVLVSSLQPGLSYTGTGSVLESQSGVYVANFVVSQLEGSMAAAGWSPVELANLRAWYLTTLGVSRNASNIVGTMDDQKVPSNTMTSGAGDEPTWIPNQANSIGMIGYDGTDFMSSPDEAGLDLIGEGTIAFIVKPDNVTTNTSVVLYKGSTGSGNGQYGVVITTDGTPNWSVGIINGTVVTSRGTLTDFASYHIVVVAYATAASTDGYIRVDGTQEGALTNQQIGAANSDPGYIGRGHINSVIETGPRVALGEIILVNGKATTSDAEKLEGYLAWRYGLEGLLPIGHPYKTAAP